LEQNAYDAIINIMNKRLFVISGGFLMIATIIIFNQGNVLAMYFFAKNLSVGNKNNDVKEIQKILNNAIDTQVVSRGPGSKGNETDFFGPLTKAAIIKFQEKYAKEILAPLNLKRGTGFVGETTRAKLNSLALSSNIATVKTARKDTGESTPSALVPTNVPTAPPPPIKTKNPAINSAKNPPKDISADDLLSSIKELTLAYPSQYTGNYGEEITLYGSGFTANDNALHFNDNYSISKISSLDKTKMTFAIPSYIPYGKYDISVSNKGGRTQNKVLFIITDPSGVQPKISKLAPISAESFNQEITVYGSGFDKEDNEIRSGYGIISGLPSADGNTLVFNISSLETISQIEKENNEIKSNEALLRFQKEIKNDLDMLIYFYIINKNGISNLGSFSLKYKP